MGSSPQCPVKLHDERMTDLHKDLSLSKNLFDLFMVSQDSILSQHFYGMHLARLLAPDLKYLTCSTFAKQTNELKVGCADF